MKTIKFVLEQEGSYEGKTIQQQAPEDLAKLFDADAILYVTTNQWDAQYALIATTVSAEFDYRIVGRDGTELWSANQRMSYTPSNNSGNPLAGLIVAAASAAITRAAPNYLPLTRQANRLVFVIGRNAIPDGPYLSTEK